MNVPMAPTGLTAGTLNQEVIHASVGSMVPNQAGGNLQLTRQARRLYVGNLPVQLGLTEKLLMDFFTNTVVSLGVATPNPILSVWISSEMTFCFVEFRSIADATACLALLQGIALGDRTLRVGRPADYQALPPAFDNYIVGFPAGAFKPPKVEGAALAGSLLNMGASGDSKGSANQVLTEAITGVVQIHKDAHSDTPTNVLHLLNMLKPDELKDDDEFKDIMEDVKEECSKHGHVGKVIIPRPGQPYDETLVGTILVLYENKEQTSKAREALNGMTFSENKVEARYYIEEKFVDIMAIAMALDLPEVAKVATETQKEQPNPDAGGEAGPSTVHDDDGQDLD